MALNHALNPKKLKSLPEGEHCDGLGLYLIVSGVNARSWVVKYQFNGKQEKVGIGRLADKGVKEARDDAKAIRVEARKGIDPKLNYGKKKVDPTIKEPEPEPVLFKDFATKILEQKIAGLKGEKSKEKARRCINVYAAPLHELPIDKISVDDVYNTLEPIWIEKPVSARETRRHLENIFGAAKAKKLINGDNPAAWKDNLKHLLPQQPEPGSLRGKNKSVPYKEMPEFMVELRALTAQSAKMLEVCILTCARTSEVIQMQWDQIDWEKGKWLIPGKVMKNKLDADVPLTDTVIRILRDIKEMGLDDKHVFPGLKAGTPVSNNTMLKLLKVDMKRKATVHGFRSSFRSWGQNKQVHSREVLEYCLHHIEGGKVELAYARDDVWEARKAALTDWETFCNSKTPPKLRLVA